MAYTIDPALKLGALATAIADRLRAVSGLTVREYEPFGESLDPLPAACVGAVTLLRTGLDEAETEFSSDDWLTSTAVTLYMALDDKGLAFAAARALVGRVVAAFDADPNLGGEADRARLSRAEMGFNAPEAKRRLIVVECELEARSLMPS